MLTHQQINQWCNKGYVVSNNILKTDLIYSVKNYLDKTYNNADNSSKDFGSEGKLEFPCGQIIDDVTINLNLIRCVKQLLKTDDILLCQSDAWGKCGNLDYSVKSNNNQRMHMDYGNNTFLHPAPWNLPETVAVIIYFSDTNITGGGTAIVPRKTIWKNGQEQYDKYDELYQFPYVNMPGQKDYIFFNNKSHSEDYFRRNHPLIHTFRNKLYDKEIQINANIGDVLFYRLDAWHRGTPVNIGQVRNVMNLLWKKKECYWINVWNPGWTKNMYNQWLEKLFIKMTPEQRSTLGIPPIGDKYWTLENIKLFKKRYPKIDTRPYYSKISRI
tara:strand:- start:426 stop:1409 length:984 start_codon:yes stop_codon:yes gene_type:complete